MIGNTAGAARAARREADLVIRAGAVRTCEPGQAVQRSLAVRGERVVAVSDDPHGLDGWVGEETRVMDAPDSTVLPSFDDTHTHLIFAGHGAFDVPVHQARDIPEFLDLIRRRAAVTPEGEWIRTTTNWQELNLAERRMPTAAELDSVTERHPVLVKRGGHNDVVNSAALRLAGISETTPEPPGGIIGKDEHGRLTGRLTDNALHLVERLVPQPDATQRVEGLRRASSDYAARGIGTVRDCAVPLPDLALLRRAEQSGGLSTRVRALVSAMGKSHPDEVDELLDAMEDWRYPRDAWLKVWGVKFVLDGGLEGAATEEPYPGHDDYCGLVLWERDALTEAVERVVRRGWRVGTHAFGDRAVRILIDVYEQVLERTPGLPTGSLVIEHGGLADPRQRARAARLGIPVTIQQPLLHDTAEAAIGNWGAERVKHLFPAREWIDQGVLVTAGSDFPVGAFGAMRSVWGMVTRGTVAGVQGPEHAISVEEAVALHTTNAARLLRESDERGALTPGRLADLTVWPADPLTCDTAVLRDLVPSHTVVGGRMVAGA
jgi:predicted amidohydrolase YtcJ